MKISIVLQEHDVSKAHWEIQQLINLLQTKQIDFNLVNINNRFVVENQIADLGTHVFWWKSKLINPVQLGTFMQLLGDKVLINGSVPGKIQNRYKSHQQTLVKYHLGIPCIDTFMIRYSDEIENLLDKNLLSYPFIQKPDYGSKGKGVDLVREKSDLTKWGEQLYKTVLQPYIENDGDFRVLIVGGEVLGIMKRCGQNGQLVNNYSQGGSVQQVNDHDTVELLKERALQVAILFGQTFCGIDFIQDSTTGEYLFMETNSIPGWKGFHEATGINVEEKIIQKYLTKPPK